MSTDSEQIATEKFRRRIEHYRNEAHEWIHAAKLFTKKHGDGQALPGTRDRMHVASELGYLVTFGMDEPEMLCAMFKTALDTVKQSVFDDAFRVHGNYTAVHACGCCVEELLAGQIYAIVSSEVFA